MRLSIDGLEVFFPYEFMYPEQFNYMLHLKRALDAKGGHALLEMPTGTGKTVCLISLISSYQFAHPETGKLIYCTRTVPEMIKCMAEIDKVIKYRVSCVGAEGGQILALSLSSRRNLCIHPKVVDEGDREAADTKCRSMTASWVRNQAAASANTNSGHIELCSFFEQYESTGSDAEIPRGVYNLEDLKDFGASKGWCPYFLARHLVNHANILVYNYQYMLDPKVRTYEPKSSSSSSSSSSSNVKRMKKRRRRIAWSKSPSRLYTQLE
jgi:DNA excision repair protein ERCC-2